MLAPKQCRFRSLQPSMVVLIMNLTYLRASGVSVCYLASLRVSEYVCTYLNVFGVFARIWRICGYLTYLCAYLRVAEQLCAYLNVSGVSACICARISQPKS